MKSLVVPALGLLLAFFATSCNFTENITVNQDGSGTATINMDASQLMALGAGQMGEAANKKIDSTINFKEVFAAKKDSIAKLPKAEQDRLKALENLSLKVLMNAEEGQLNVDIINNFKKIGDLTDVMKNFRELAGTGDAKKAEALNFLNNHSTVSYAYDGKTFKRNVVADKTTAPVSDSLSMYKPMMEGSTYTLKYSFPKKVAKVSNPAAIIGADRKTVSITYDLIEYLENPTQLGLQVEFEK